MYADLGELSRLIPLVISFVLMGAMGAIVVINDMRRLSVKMWQLLLLVAVPMLAILVSRVWSGQMAWYWLLMPAIYIVLNLLNTALNKNRVIGQADIDILNGVVAISVPVSIYVMSTPYDLYGDSIHLMQITGVIADLNVWLFLGLLTSLIIALVRRVVDAVRGGITLDSIKTRVTTRLMSPLKPKSDDEKSLKGRKIPVCLSFIPMLFAATYIAIYISL